jgi:GGDEF domain-containing protein
LSTRQGAGKARNIPGALLALLRKDPFTRIRTDDELAALVRQTAARASRPYATLVHHLVGADEHLDEEQARQFWLDAVSQRRRLSTALGRPVALRVAALDLLTSARTATEVQQPVLVSPLILGSVLESLTTDALTGLANREHFFVILSHELRQRFRLPPVVAYVDLDRFKAVNDQYGHSRGDALLAELGHIWERQSRRGDLMARMGGDEFAALFAELDGNKGDR